MPNELSKIRQENTILKKKLSDLEFQFEKKSLQLQKASINLEKESLKFDRQKFKFEQKIASLEAEIIFIKENQPPTLSELMSHAGKQLKRAEEIKNTKNSDTPE